MLSFKTIQTPFPSPSYTDSQDEPTPAQRARDAAISAALTARRAMGIVDGRDWTGALIEHPSNCRGNCCIPDVNPRETADYILCQQLFNTQQAEDMLMYKSGMSWYAMFFPDGYDPEWDAMMRSHIATKADRILAQDRSIAASNQKLIEEKVALEARRHLHRGDKVEKNGRLCTRLYSCVGDKASGGAKPSTMHVSSECWSHERVDPISGKLLTPHKCPFLHPGEPGWNSEWMTSRLWQPPAAPVAATRVWTQDNRFTAAAATASKPHSHSKRNTNSDGWDTPKRR